MASSFRVLGKALEPTREHSQFAQRTFENGLVVLNDSENRKEVECTLAHGFHHTRLLNLFDGNSRLDVRGGRVAVAVPRKSARIYTASK